MYDVSIVLFQQLGQVAVQQFLKVWNKDKQFEMFEDENPIFKWLLHDQHLIFGHARRVAYR